jgi:hypothetical protein
VEIHQKEKESAMSEIKSAKGRRSFNSHNIDRLDGASLLSNKNGSLRNFEAGERPLDSNSIY